MIALWVINPCLGNTGFYKFLTSVMGSEYVTYSSTSDESRYYWTVV